MANAKSNKEPLPLSLWNFLYYSDRGDEDVPAPGLFWIGRDAVVAEGQLVRGVNRIAGGIDDGGCDKDSSHLFDLLPAPFAVFGVFNRTQSHKDRLPVPNEGGGNGLAVTENGQGWGCV